MRKRAEGYSRQEFDAAVARARACLDREESAAAAAWYSFEQYPAISPHPSQAGYPALEIGRTAGDLEKFLFIDALARVCNRLRPNRQSACVQFSLSRDRSRRAVAGIYLLPAMGMASASSGLAYLALSAGYPTLAATVLKPAASAGDPQAMNDLGVLRFRGVGVEADPAEAARLLSAAAATGLPRARLNLIVAVTPRCSAISKSKQMFEELEALAQGGDIFAASFAADCFGGKWLDMRFADETPHWAERLLKLAEIGGRGDAEEKVKFAWLLVVAVRELDDQKSLAAGDRAIADRLLHLAARLFVEARPDKPAAYYGLSALSGSYSDRLAKSPVVGDVMAHTAEGWLLAGAEAGHMISRCAVTTRALRTLCGRADQGELREAVGERRHHGPVPHAPEQPARRDLHP